MPEYGGNITPWAGGFRASSPGVGTGSYNAAARSAENEFLSSLGNAIGSGFGHAIDTGMKSYENKQVVKEGTAAIQKFQGEETTNEQAAESVAGFETATANREGLNAAQLRDLDEKALRTFGTDMRRIGALLEAKKISSMQANAQAQSLMQNALSNPRTAMFTEKYKQLAAPILGTSKDGGTTVGTYFDQTPEEKARAALAKGAIDDAVKRQSQINELKSTFGFSEEQAVDFVRHSAMREERVKQAQATTAMANATTASVNANMAVQNQRSQAKLMSTMAEMTDTAERFSISVSGLVKQNGGSIPDDQIPFLKDAAEKVYIDTIQKAKGLTPEHQKVVLENADFQRKRMLTMFEDRSALKALETANKDISEKTNNLTGKAIYQLASAMPDVAGAYKLGPDYGKFYVDLRSGSMEAGMKAHTNPWLRNIKDQLGNLNIDKLAVNAVDKITNGNSQLTAPEAQSFSVKLSNPGAAAAIVKTIETNPASLEAIRTTYATEGTSLSMFNSNMEWKAAMKTKEGQKTVVEALKGATEQARAMQIRKGFPTRGLSIERQERVDEMTGISAITAYNIKSTGIALDPHVANNLGQAVMILDQHPEIAKLMGVASADEWLSKVFDMGTNRMASPRITKPESLPTPNQQSSSAVAPTTARSNWGVRGDGTTKGDGYFGQLQMTDGSGRVMTELGAGFNINGKEVETPLVNPLLSKSELDHLLAGGEPTKDIINKGRKWAQQRLKEGKPAFATDDEIGKSQVK